MKKYAIELFYVLTGKPSLLSSTSEQEVVLSASQDKNTDQDYKQLSNIDKAQTPVLSNTPMIPIQSFPTSPYHLPVAQQLETMTAALPVNSPAYTGGTMYTPVKFVGNRQDNLVPVPASPNFSYNLTDAYYNNYGQLDHLNRSQLQVQQSLSASIPTREPTGNASYDTTKTNVNGLLNVITKFL